MSGQSWRDRPPLSQTFPHIRTPWKAIAAEARDAIRRGDMAPGEPFGSITRIARMYGVSRGTAHKALRALAAEGLAELEPGMGYFVPSGAALVDVVGDHSGHHAGRRAERDGDAGDLPPERLERP